MTTGFIGLFLFFEIFSILVESMLCLCLCCLLLPILAFIWVLLVMTKGTDKHWPNYFFKKQQNKQNFKLLRVVWRVSPLTLPSFPLLRPQRADWRKENIWKPTVEKATQGSLHSCGAQVLCPSKSGVWGSFRPGKAWYAHMLVCKFSGLCVLSLELQSA